MTTAINIGFSCRLLTSDMHLIILDKEQDGDGKEPVLNRLKALHLEYCSITQQDSVRQSYIQDKSSKDCTWWCKSKNKDTPDLCEMKTDHLGLVVDGPSLLEILDDPLSKRMLLEV